MRNDQRNRRVTGKHGGRARQLRFRRAQIRFYCNFRRCHCNVERACGAIDAVPRDRRANQERQDEEALYRAARAMTVSVLRMRRTGMMRGGSLREGVGGK